MVATNRHFAAGTNGFVQIANNIGQGGRNVAADAVKWAYSANQVEVPPVTVTARPPSKPSPDPTGLSR